ncbi:MAG: hypothetical protein KAW14_01855 [Candidatus Aegiribacteria sp.]|nr:hypothetical protein [Candidatus Aegiribacteria sp.]
MIQDIPNAESFRDAGIEYLNKVWENSVQLLFRDDMDESEREPVLTHTQSNSNLALLHQGVDFLLKSRLADISPYLLLVGRSNHWPKSVSTDISFSDFRIIDSHDLVKAVNIVSKDRLPAYFGDWHKAIRNARNRAIHTVDSNQYADSIELIRLVLEASEFLFEPKQWLRIRRDFLHENDLSQNNHEPEISEAYLLGCLQREFLNAIDNLSLDDVSRHFDFNPKKDRHICQYCLEIREREYFFELKNEEKYYLATAYWINEDRNDAYCLFCEEARIDETHP